jgi:uncharacterized protein (TIGR02391 family)
MDKKRIDQKRAIELLKEALSEIPHLKELRYDNQEFILWFDKVRDVIQAGLDENDQQRFPSSRKVTITTSGPLPSDDAFQRLHLFNLDNYETALRSIIQKYEVVGLEGEPAIAAEPPSRTAKVPNYLFGKMQFHPGVIAASKSLFESGHYAQAIFEAFKAVNNFIKQKTGLDLDGKQLMAKAFDEKGPVIRLNELKTQSDRDEQEGFKFLFMGAIVGIRNPKAHENIIQNNPYIALQLIGFASLLMKKAEEGKVKRPRKNVQNI